MNITKELGILKGFASDLKKINDLSHFELYVSILKDFIDLHSSQGENSQVSLPYTIYDDILEALKEKSVFFASKECIIALQKIPDTAHQVIKEVSQVMAGFFINKVMPQLANKEQPSEEELLEAIWVAEQVSNRGIKEYLLDKLTVLYPNNIQGILEKVDRLIQSKRLKEAYSILLENASNQDAFTLREAIILSVAGHPMQALKKLNTIENPSLEYIEELFYLGQKALLLNNKELPVFYKKMLATYPSNNYLQFLHGEEHFLNNRLQDAIHLYTLIKKAPLLEPQTSQRLVQAYQKLHKPQDAMQELFELTLKQGFKWHNLPDYVFLTKVPKPGVELMDEVEGVYFDEPTSTYIVTNIVGLVFLLVSGLHDQVYQLKITHSSVDLRNVVLLLCQSRWVKLQKLHIHCETLDDLTLLELTIADFFKHLTELTIQGGKVNLACFREFLMRLSNQLRALTLQHLTTLNKLTLEKQMTSLLKDNTVIQNLTTFVIESCDLVASDFEEICRIPFTRITSFSIVGNDLSGFDLKKLEKSRWFRYLDELAISYTSIERLFLTWFTTLDITNQLTKIHIAGDWSLNDYLTHEQDYRFFWGEIQLDTIS